MSRLVFDIETQMKPEEEWDKTVFLNNVDKLTCLCVRDVDTDEIWTFHDSPLEYNDGSLVDGIKMLLRAELLIGHNIRNFDIPAIIKLYPKTGVHFARSTVFDTLTASRQLFSWKDLISFDERHEVEHTAYNTKALHSLGAWGDRFVANGRATLSKDEEFKANVDWSNLEVTKELLSYCMQDVDVNVMVWTTLIKKKAKMDKDTAADFE